MMRAALMVLLFAMTPALTTLTPNELAELRGKYKQGLNLAKDNKNDEAIAEFRKCLKEYGERLSHSTRLRLYYVSAMCYYRSGRAKRALAVIKRCREMAPLSPKVQQAYEMIEKAAADDDPKPSPSPSPSPAPSPKESGPPPPSPAEAERAFKDGENAYKLAVKMIDMAQEYEKDLDQAIADLDIARRGTYRLDRVLYYSGAARNRRVDEDKKDISMAIEMLTESQKLSPDPRTLMELGTAYGLSGNVDKETDAYEQALALDPELHEAHFKAAVAYDKSKKEGAARLTFEHAKAAIRGDAKYKAKFQNMLKNSDVAKLIADEVTDIIKKSEDGELSDEQIDEAAKKFEKLLGGGGKGLDIKKMLRDPKVKAEIEKLPKDKRDSYINDPAKLQRLIEQNTPARKQ